MEQTTAYRDDLEYIQHELGWVEARLEGVGAELKLSSLGRSGRRRGLREAHAQSPDDLLKQVRRGLGRAEELRADIERRLAATRAGGRVLGLDALCAANRLDTFERQVVLLASAPVFSRRFEDAYDALDPESRWGGGLTVEATFAFAGLDLRERIGRRRSFTRGAPLVAGDVISVCARSRWMTPKDLLGLPIEITASALSVIVGDDRLADELAEFSRVEAPRGTLDQVVLDSDDKRRILSVVERHDAYLEARRAWGFDEVISYGRGVLMLFHGEPGTGKTLTAHAVAERMGKRVLNVDIPTFLEHGEAMRFLPALFRQARLQDALLFFDECEVLFATRRQGNALMTMLLGELERFEGVAVLATNLPEQLDEALDRRILVKVRFPRPDVEAREAIWRQHLPTRAPLGDCVDPRALAVRYEMSGGYIKNAVLAAVADAVHQGGEQPVISQAILERAAADQLRRPTDGDSDLVVPRCRLTDVVLPAPMAARLEELVAAVRHRQTVLDRWGVGAHLAHGKGLSALFHGPSGTGKTLCAEAVAAELGQPLLVATVPGIVSKWVGETERNLEFVFRRAREQQAVVFLDECDSLLRARGAGRASRHDDAAVNVLLTQLERHEGLVLLATNRPEELDPSLTRRLTYDLGFPLPDAPARANIWRGLLPPTVPTDDTVDVEALGAAWTLSGGHIKNAVLMAAFRAAIGALPVSGALLEAAAREEAQVMSGTASSRAIGLVAAAGRSGARP